MEKSKVKSAHIVVILDRSGSMASIKHDAIGGFNTFLAQQKAQPGKARMTLVQFDHEYEVLCDRKALSRTKKLSAETYVPRGATALLDAIGRTVGPIKPEKGEKVIVAILTDGHENSSREWTKAQINELIDAKRDEGFEFIYLGANQDAFAEAASIGINSIDTVNFQATGKGIRSAYETMANTVSDYRNSEVKGS